MLTLVLQFLLKQCVLQYCIHLLQYAKVSKSIAYANFSSAIKPSYSRATIKIGNCNIHTVQYVVFYTHFIFLTIEMHCHSTFQYKRLIINGTPCVFYIYIYFHIHSHAKTMLPVPSFKGKNMQFFSNLRCSFFVVNEMKK